MDRMSDYEQWSNWLQLDLILLLVNFSCELDVASYGLDKWSWAMFEPTWTLPNFTFG